MLVNLLLEAVLFMVMLSPQAPYKVTDRFPYTIELRVKDPNMEPPICSYINSILMKDSNLEEPKNTEEPDRTLFRKGSQHPSAVLISHTVSGSTSLELKLSYTKEDFPAARVLPSVGKFNIKIPYAAETLKVKAKLNKNGIIEMVSAEVDSQVVMVSENSEVSLTSEEFNKAKQTEHTLSDREQQADQSKKQRNLLESCVNSTRTKLQSGYKAFASDIEYEQLSETLLLIEEWLYEGGDDVHSEEELSQKLNIETLWEPIETRWKDDDKMVGSTSLIALINSSSEFANSLSPEKKLEFETECSEVKKFLSCDSSTELDPSTFKKKTLGICHRLCEEAVLENSGRGMKKQNNKLVRYLKQVKGWGWTKQANSSNSS